MKRRNLLRKESFGGTILLASGHREYLNEHEYAVLAQTQTLTAELAKEFDVSVLETVVIEPPFLPTNNFSAPNRVFFEVTRECNLTCSHCFNSSGKALPRQLCHSQIVSVIDDLAGAGVQEIRLTGGEPTTYQGLVELVSQITGLDLQASIGTNAALINSRLGEALAGAGLRSAVVSLDGLEETHDRVRGQGSFRATMAGLEILRENKVAVRVNSVVMKSTTQSVLALVELLTLRDIPVMLRRLIPSGRATHSSGEMLSAEDYSRLREVLKPHLEDGRRLVAGHYLGGTHQEPRFRPLFGIKDCSAGHRGMVILPTGHIQTCGFLAPLGEASVGQVPTERFSSIWQRLTNSDHIERLEDNLAPHNETTCGPVTNCLAIALASTRRPTLLQISGLKRQVTK